MTRVELVAAVAEKASITKKDAEAAIKATLEEIRKTDKVVLVGFGTFSYKTRAARKGRNPQNGAEIQIAEKRVLTFKPATQSK